MGRKGAVHRLLQTCASCVRQLRSCVTIIERELSSFNIYKTGGLAGRACGVTLRPILYDRLPKAKVKVNSKSLPRPVYKKGQRSLRT